VRCPRAERNPIAWAAVELPTALPRPAHLMDCSAGRVRSRHGDPRLGCSLFLPSAPSLCWLEEIPHGCSGGSRRYLLLPVGVTLPSSATPWKHAHSSQVPPSCLRVRSLPYVPGEGSATDYCFTGAASSSVISVTALKEERRVEKVQPAAQQMTQA